MEIKLLETAQTEIDEAYTYYESQAKGLGSKFLDEIFGVIKSIKTHPKAWPNFSKRTKRCISPKFPYAVIYQLRDNIILIVAVAHLHRKPDYWKDRV